MNRQILLPLILLAIMATRATSQPATLNPLHVHDGLQAARASAVKLLASDAVPVFVGAVGNQTFYTDGMPIELRFYLEDGSSTAWAYSFYSPSLKRREFIVAIDLPSVGVQAFPESSPIPVPELETAIDMTLPYAGSDKAIERLKRDSVYIRYRNELPAMLPEGIALRMPDHDDSTLVPSSFPLDRPVWIMNFTGEGSRTMICYVATGTGATYCLRATVATVEEEVERGGEMRLSDEIGDRGRGR